MHEQSLIKTLLRQVDEIRCQHEGGQVTEVRIEVGPLTGVEPLLLVSAFQLLAPQGTAGCAKLVIDEVPLLARCKSCCREFEVDDFVFRCPTCDGNVKVIHGDAFHLVGVSLCETDSEPCDRSAPATRGSRIKSSSPHTNARAHP